LIKKKKEVEEMHSQTLDIQVAGKFILCNVARIVDHSIVSKAYLMLVLAIILGAELV